MSEINEATDVTVSVRPRFEFSAAGVRGQKYEAPAEEPRVQVRPSVVGPPQSCTFFHPVNPFAAQGRVVG